LGYQWLHREDGIKNGRVRFNFAMEETSELLQNGIAATVYAYFVPHLALEQFGGSLHEFNKSYNKEQGAAGAVIPFFEKNKYWNGTAEVTDSTPNDFDTNTSNGRAEFYQMMGIHLNGSTVNNTLVQSYNTIVNHRRKARSSSLPLRNQYDHTLAEAFWLNTSMENIVPDFDQKLIDGEVSLSGLTFQAPIKSNRLHRPYNNDYLTSPTLPSSNTNVVPTQYSSDLSVDGDHYVFEEMFAEMQTGGDATMSLADIELAKKTAAFARARQQFSGLDDQNIIDLLMSGIRVPEQAMTQPILIGKQRAMIGYNQRYATDGANLDQSATVGSATVEMNVRLPQMNCGGTLMFCAEIMPERLFERKKCHFMHMDDPAELPNALPDLLDPEAVRIIRSDEIDVYHSTPDATFGYAPLNTEWKRDNAQVGGKFYRPINDAFLEDRERIWSTETIDPTLSASWYLCEGLHKKVFADQNADSFEISMLADLNITGLTQFGDALIETDTESDYEHITDQVQTARIEK
jgi:hypothetical protein